MNLLKDIKLISSGYRSKNCTIPNDLLDFNFSYGYDCKRPFNLCLISEVVLVFVSGNIIHFFNTSTHELSFRRSALGEGIGFIEVNPNPAYNYLTVAENGLSPCVFIYEYPTMRVISLCMGGTTTQYTCLCYSPDGEMLATQGSGPDYTLAIWNWKDGIVLLRSKSAYNTVHNVNFSLFNYGQLVTSGVGQIRFWKMVNTFTAFKLNGQLGRFGKTEISDILAVFPMSNEQVLSGCEWGNILVWEEGLITKEVRRRLQKPCHSQPITQIFMHNSEIVSVGLDGYVRLWNWVTVDLANPPEEDRVVEIEPIYEYAIGDDFHSCEMFGLHRMARNTDVWYVQDGGGGIWKCNINCEHRCDPSECLFRCHSGPILAIATCPSSHFFITLGEDCNLHMYDFVLKKLVFYKKMKSKGNDILWVPTNIINSGQIIVIGSEDGCIRIYFVDIKLPNVQLLQQFKSHKYAITKIAINNIGSALVSGGKDNIFCVHQIIKTSTAFQIIAIGFIETPSTVTTITWKPSHNNVVLLGCSHGEILEGIIPDIPQKYTTKSFHLWKVKLQTIQFVSVKSEINQARQIKDIQHRKKKRLEDKNKKLQTLLSENPEIEIKSDYLDDSEPEEEPDPIFVPDPPNAVLWLKYLSSNTFLISMAGFDAGFLYIYQLGNDRPIKTIDIQDKTESEINCFLELDEFFIFGMENGAIRVIENKNDVISSSNYYTIGMHDNKHGKVTALAFSCDRSIMFSIGTDGGIFSYILPQRFRKNNPRHNENATTSFESIDDEDGSFYLTFEEQKQLENYNKIMNIANIHKNKIKFQVGDLLKQLEKFFEMNSNLHESQRLRIGHIKIDKRIYNEFVDKIKDNMKVEKQKMRYENAILNMKWKKLKNYIFESIQLLPITTAGICIPEKLSTIRILKLSAEYNVLLKEIDKRIQEDLEKRRLIKIEEEIEEKEIEVVKEKVFFFLDNVLLKYMDVRMRRILLKYKERKSIEEKRDILWRQMLSEKPDPNVNRPEDIQVLIEAEQMMGMYNLKCNPLYEPPENLQETILKRIQCSLWTEAKIRKFQNYFNEIVVDLRDNKKHMVKSIQEIVELLEEIHQKLEIETQVFPNVVPRVNQPLEYPESHLKMIQCATIKRKRTSLIGNRIKHRIKYLIGFDILKHTNELVKLQKHLLEIINKTITNYDNKIHKTIINQYQLEIDYSFMQLFLRNLSKQILILKDYDSMEDQLIDLYNVQKILRVQFRTIVNEKKETIKKCHSKIQTKAEQLDRVHDMFGNVSINIIESEFVEFLNTLFEKVVLDINDLCPEQLDQDLFDEVLVLRSERIKLKNIIETNIRLVEQNESIILKLEEKIVNIDIEMDSNYKRFNAFKIEKQIRLNESFAFVVLNYNKLPYCTSEYQLGYTILFDDMEISKLYGRIGEITLETKEVKRRLRIDMLHMARLKTDIKFLETTVTKLKESQKFIITKKLGRIYGLDEIEIAILKKMFFNMRVNIDPIKKEFTCKIAEAKFKLAEKHCELNRELKENTEKLNILTLLFQQERYISNRLRVNHQIQVFVEKGYGGIPFEIIHLKDISRMQKLKINSLEMEISALRLKAKPVTKVYYKISSLNATGVSPLKEQQLYSVFSDVGEHIEVFLNDCLRSRLDENIIKEAAFEISKHFFNTFQTVTSENFMKDQLKEFANQIRSVLSKEVAKYVSSERIASTFAKIIKLVQVGKKEKFWTKIVADIIDETAKTIPMFSMDYSQKFVATIFKEMLLVFPANIILIPDFPKEIAIFCSKNKIELETYKIDVNSVMSSIIKMPSINWDGDIKIDNLIHIANKFILEFDKLREIDIRNN